MLSVILKDVHLVQCHLNGGHIEADLTITYSYNRYVTFVSLPRIISGILFIDKSSLKNPGFM